MTRAIAVAVLSATTLGCQSFKEGDLAIFASAEGVAIGDEDLPFVDGWNVSFSKYLVSISGLTVSQTEGDAAGNSQAHYVVDLAQQEPRIELMELLNPQRWDVFSFSVEAPDTKGRVKLLGATDEDVTRLEDGGYNYWIEGTADKDGQTLTFAWGLSNPADYEACTNGVDDTQGVVVTNNTVTNVEITIHVAHLFFDTLGTEQNRQRFGAIAAKAEADGTIPFGALASQSLSDLRDANGDPLHDQDGPVVYHPGATVLPTNNLQQFILASTRVQAHVGGDGLCTITPK